MDNPFQGLNQHLLFIKENLSSLIKEVKELRDSKPLSSNEERYIDKKEAAKIAGVSVSTIDNWRRSKKIQPYYFDSAVRFRYEEFVSFLSAQKLDS